MVKINSPKDFWAGAMFIAFGLFFAIGAYINYQMGSAVRMGPAYFPAVLGGLLATLGAVIFAQAFVASPTGKAIGNPFRASDAAIAAISVAVAAGLSRLAFGTAQYGVFAAILGLAVLANRLRLRGPSAALPIPFNIADMAIAVVIAYAGIRGSLALGWSSDYGVMAAVALLSLLAVLYRPGAKPLMLIFAATLVYGYLMKPAGLFIATFASVLVAGLAGHEFRWKEVLILGVVLALFSYLVFVKGLTLPFPLCPDAIDNCPIR